MTLIERGAGGGESPQLPLIRNRDARGTTTSAGGGEGGRGRPRRNADATCRRVCNRATRPKTTKIVQTSTRNPPQRKRQPNAIAAPGGQRARGGARGRPCRNADATCRRVGHRAMQPTPPPVNVRAINADSSSATSRPNAMPAPGGRRAWGGGEGPPAPQCGSHHPSTRRPSTRC